MTDVATAAAETANARRPRRAVFADLAVVSRSVGRRHVAWAAATAVVVIALSVVMEPIPGLGWGWMSLLSTEGAPNAAVAPALVTAPAVGLVFVVLLAVCVPYLALMEEAMFRRGSEDRSPGGRVVWALGFGLAHMVMGVSLGTALALAVGGWIFTKMGSGAGSPRL